MANPTILAALNTFQQAANRGTAVHLSPELVQELRDALKAEPEGEGPTTEELDQLYREIHGLRSDVLGPMPLKFARAVLARWACPATPPAPGPPAEALAARPLLEQVAAMADCIGAQTVGQITAISNRAAAWLRENPPGQPVAVEPRGCPTPGACSCVEPAPPAPEPGELVAWLKEEAEAYRNTCGTNLASQNLDNAATLLLEQGTELAALREERFVAGQNRINQLWVDALDPSTQVPLSAPQIKKLRKVLDDYCDQGPPNGTMWKSQELEELMWAVEGWVSAATPLPAPQAGEVHRSSTTMSDNFRTQVTDEASSRYPQTSQNAEFDAFTQGASWAFVTHAPAAGIREAVKAELDACCEWLRTSDPGCAHPEWKRERATRLYLARWGVPATPPAPETGEVPSDELMGQWKEECKRLSLESDYAIPASSFMAQRVVAWARQQQATELSALQGEVGELVKFLGTLAAAPILLQQQATELAALRKPPHPTFLDAIRLAQGCHDYSGGHSGQQGEAFQDGVGTVVAVLKKAAVGPWDSQTMAVFGIGSAPQAGEGEA